MAKSYSDKQADDTATEFFVLEGGTLVIANFDASQLRLDLYDISDSWKSSPAILAGEAEMYPPLAWEIDETYETILEEVQYEIDDAEFDENKDSSKVKSLKRLLESMRENYQEGLEQWLSNLDLAYFNQYLVPHIREWLSSEPNWAFERDYIPERKSAQGAALEYFQELDPDARNALGIRIVEGEFPGSTYYAAELKKDIEDASNIAAKMNLDVRFRRSGTQPSQAK